MQHPSDDLIAALVQGALPDAEVARLHEHVDGCADCRQLIAVLARQEGDDTIRERARAAENASPASPDAPKSDVAPAAANVGRYQILKHLASGGMGAVYAAYDPELDRRVALKVLARTREGKAMREELQVRLQREAQAMARLAHPNVVSVHDVGTYNGRVFLAMEFVEGLTLRQWLKPAGPAGSDGKKRGWREIRDVFVQAGRGLAAAHAVGLVHRDFKPDNVLIGDDGRVRVADFGLARPGRDNASKEGSKDSSGPQQDVKTPTSNALRTSLVTSPLTEAGVVMGTPRYMAPEQIRAEDTDARTDQFSFGVALFEALYGVKPFEGKDLDDRLRKIEGGALVQVPAGHGVPEWLGRATRRALKADPQERFASMDALLDALNQDARRRLGAGVLAAATITALAAIAGTSYAVRPDLRCKGAERKLAGIWDGTRREAVKAAFVATGVPGAEAQFERVAQALDGYATSWASKSEEVCAATRLRGEHPESVLTLQTACLELRLKELRKLEDLFESADAALVQKAPDAALGLSSVKGCADVTALTELVPLPDDPKKRYDIEELKNELAEANAIRLAGRYPVALEKAAAIAERAKTTGYRPIDAEALYLRGVVEDQLGKHDEAEQSLVAAIVAAEAGRADVLKAQAASRLVYANGLASKYTEGKRWAELAQASLDRLGGNPEQEGELLNYLGSLYLNEGGYAKAAEIYERALKLLERELGPDHPKTFIARTNLASAYNATRKHKEAIVMLGQAIPAMEKLRGADHPSLLGPLLALTSARIEQRQFLEAHESINRALEIARARFGPDHVRVAQALEWKATAYQEERRYGEALELYQQALRIKQQQLQPDDPELSFAYDGIGQCLLGLDRAKEALPTLLTALKLRGPGPVDRGDTRFAISRTLWRLNQDRTKALTYAEQAREDFKAGQREDKVRQVEAWIENNGANDGDRLLK